MTEKKRYVVGIVGNIGVGKSTLASLLAKKLGWVAILEPANANPYLTDFYADMLRWSFNSQVFFLSRRLVQYRLVSETSRRSVLHDRTIYEDAEVFARHLYQLGYMEERDWRTYRELYETVRHILVHPDLVVYLRASVATLVRRVSQRGHEYETNLPEAYLSSLDELYERWAAEFALSPLIRIDTDIVDFAHRESDLDAVTANVLAALNVQVV